MSSGKVVEVSAGEAQSLTNYKILDDGTQVLLPAAPTFFSARPGPAQTIEEWANPVSSQKVAEGAPRDPYELMKLMRTPGDTTPNDPRQGQPLREMAFSGEQIPPERLIDLATDPILGNAAANMIDRYAGDTVQRQIDLANARSAEFQTQRLELRLKTDAMLEASLARSGAKVTDHYIEFANADRALAAHRAVEQALNGETIDMSSIHWDDDSTGTVVIDL
jgi:hypothetical protein